MTSSTNLFTVEFYRESKYSISSIGDFNHPDGALFNVNKIGPVATKDRGFYFSDTSRLVTPKSDILAPNFGISIILRIISPGIIFSIINETDSIFLLSSDLENIIGEYRTCLLNVCSLKPIKIPHKFEWSQITLTSVQLQGILSVYVDWAVNYISGEFTPIPSLSYFFGSSSSGLKGFIYTFILANSRVIVGFNSLPNLCSETQYFMESQCYECNPSNIWPLCSFGSGSQCFSQNCTQCTGYGYADCVDCVSGSNPELCLKAKNCLNGTKFLCETCEDTFIKTNSLCINPPEPIDSDLRAVHVDFGNFIDKNPFFGFEFDNYTDIDETLPTPMVKRGYYFGGSSYLKSKVKISLNYSFVLSFWFFPTGGYIIYNSKTLTAYSGGYMSIKVSNNEENVTAYTNSHLSKLYWWTFVAFSVTFQDPITRVYQNVDGKESEVLAVSGYAFYDVLGDGAIGCSLNKGYCYIGFIYSFDIWQYYFKITNISTIFECANWNTLCLWGCPLNTYYNAWEKQCLPCHSSCLYGCKDWSNCEKCPGLTCSSCESNYTGNCLVNKAQSDSCAPSLTFRNSVCCESSCLSCYGPYFFKCISCESPQLLSDYICVDICPTGYTQNSTSCTQIPSHIFWIELTNYSSPSYELKSMSVLKFGSNNEVLANPSDQTSPIPTGYRGYYFNSSRFITGPKLIIASSFSFYFWIWTKVDGVVFKKGNLEMYSNSSLKYDINIERNQKILTQNHLTMGIKNAWAMYSVAFSKSYAGITTITFGENAAFNFVVTHNYYVYFDSVEEDIIVGSVNDNSFHGFLYMMKMYNFAITITNVTSNFNSKYNTWSCGLGYYNEKGCKLCDAKCDTCVRSGDCILCNDMKCENCTSFTSKCAKCLNNSILDSTTKTCSCPTFTYWNQSTLYCEPCPNLCKNCSNSTYCNTCAPNSKFAIPANSACACDPWYFQLNSSFCEKCHTKCLRCNDVTNISCLDCVINSHLVNISECTCDDGNYWVGKNCTGCYRLCKTCTGVEINQCTNCKANLLLENSTCICPNKTYWDESMFYCNSCEESCKDCTGRMYYHCTTCYDGDFMLNGFCTVKCPLGYKNQHEGCVFKTAAYVRFRFNEVNGQYKDERNGILALPGLYKQESEFDPIPAYARGVYFYGNQSFLRFENLEKKVLFGPDFCILMWTFPEISNGILVKYFHNETLKFYLSLGELEVKTEFFIFDESFEYKSGLVLKLGEWNHVMLVVTFDLMTDVFARVNKLSSYKRSMTVNPFKDFMGSSFYIGGYESSAENFKGFMYLMEFYVYQPEDYDLFYTGECENCSMCLTDGTCISNCNITSFIYVNTCQKCLESCTSGCRSNLTCGLCFDTNCEKCKNYNEGSCEKCNEGYEVINGYCSKCQGEVYYSSKKKICVPCEGLCETCISSTQCLTCLNHSSLTTPGNCSCDFGYFLDKICKRKRFSAFISIDFRNKALITFSEKLLLNLTIDNLDVYLNTELINYELNFKQDSEYFIVINNKKVFAKGDKLIVKFKGNIVSIQNSLIFDDSLTILLSGEDSNGLASAVESAKGFADVALTVSIGSSLGSFAMISDPTYFFNFLTNVEMYSYVALYDLDFDPFLMEFLNSIQVQSKFPNAFKYLIPGKTKKHLKSKFKDFGYESNLILHNSGVNFTIISVLITLLPILYMIPHTKISFIQRKITQMRSSYKYEVFLRLFIQTFFEIYLNSLLSIKTFDSISVLSIIDLIMSSICLVTFI